MAALTADRLPPPDRAVPARAALLTALCLGALAEALLRTPTWGLNIALWTLAFTSSVGALVLWRRDAFGPVPPWLVVPVLLVGVAPAWRDSPVLKTLDVLALATAL